MKCISGKNLPFPGIALNWPVGFFESASVSFLAPVVMKSFCLVFFFYCSREDEGELRECNAASGCPAVFLLAVVLKTLSFSIFFEGASFSTKRFLIFVQEH